MDEDRFHIGTGRYDMLVNSRFKNYSYGKDSFIEDEELGKERHGTYGGLLFDKRWIAKRAEILARDQNACVICKDTMSLQVHHRQYHFIKALKQFKAPWDYENHLMITLCEKCHSRGHSKYKIPNVYV